MSEACDPLEAELEALIPREPSHDFARRIGQRLSRRSFRPWPAPPLGRAALVVVCLGATVVAATLLGLHYRTRPQEKETLTVRPTVPPPLAVEDPPPTLQAYHRALAESPESFDSLLDRRSDATAAAASTPSPPYAFPRSAPDLGKWIGDN